ncbi:hypothetical protein KVT40_002147 [Elsinoe batatas]|uniref:Uncharacterized protein n=1 Tax=Elsinoe batatas TaxID=2601811 RepID=A0A8K0L9E0_9PEZI|nr:hypothetical protein KVT40_002147 [Elsinoe batatas]
MSSDDQPPPEPASLVDARRTANVLNILLGDLTKASKTIKDQGADADALDEAAITVTDTANEAKDLLRMLRKGMETQLQSSETLNNRVATGLEAASNSIDSSATATVGRNDALEFLRSNVREDHTVLVACNRRILDTTLELDPPQGLGIPLVLHRATRTLQAQACSVDRTFKISQHRNQTQALSAPLAV